MLTVACVYKTFTDFRTGGSYDASWIQKLQRAVSRNLTVPHRFVCLSNSFVPEVDVIPLQNDWTGWWSKIEMFRPGLFNGPVLSLDLDVTFTSNIDFMAGPFPNMMMLKDIVPTIKNSTCMWWDATDPRYGEIYERFRRDPKGLMEFHHLFNMQSMGDQGFITDTVTEMGIEIDLWQEKFDPDLFIPFSFFSRLNPAMDNVTPTPDPFSYLNTLVAPDMSEDVKKAKMVYCLGKPKFETHVNLEVVKRYWL